MNKLLSLLAGVLLTVLSVNALAAAVSVSWTHPTQYTDGAALTAGDIEHTRIEYGSCTGTASPYAFGTKAGEFLAVRVAATDAVPPQSATLEVPGWGRKCYRAFTKLLASAGDQTSGPSAVVTKVTPSPVPNPPGFVSAGVQLVYTLKRNIDGALVLNKPVGTVPDGTACGDWTMVKANGLRYHKVQREDVDFTKATTTMRLAAACVAA